MSEQEREIEVVAGVIGGITQKKEDTWTVAVQVEGLANAKNLWTKDSELVQSLQSKFGQHGAFVCSASYWQHPQHGQVRSLWINSLADPADVTYEPAKPAKSTPEAAVALARVEGSAKPQNRSYAPDLKDRMIVRQTALKAAAEIMAANTSVHPDYDPALEVMKAAQRFETWVYRDIDPPPFAPEMSEHDQEIPY